jgi:hypothetical protein
MKRRSFYVTDGEDRSSMGQAVEKRIMEPTADTLSLDTGINRESNQLEGTVEPPPSPLSARAIRSCHHCPGLLVKPYPNPTS